MSISVSIRAAAAAVLSLGLAVGISAATPIEASAAGGCSLTFNYPHYSHGAGGVIVKARVKCDYDRTVRFTGYLGSGPYIGPYTAQRSNVGESRWVAAGTTATFYVPRYGTTGLACRSNAYYEGWGHITVNGVTDYRGSRRVQVGCP